MDITSLISLLLRPLVQQRTERTFLRTIVIGIGVFSFVHAYVVGILGAFRYLNQSYEAAIPYFIISGGLLVLSLLMFLIYTLHKRNSLKKQSIPSVAETFLGESQHLKNVLETFLAKEWKNPYIKNSIVALGVLLGLRILSRLLRPSK